MVPGGTAIPPRTARPFPFRYGGRSRCSLGTVESNPQANARRGRLAAIITVGHAVKHLYMGALEDVLMAQIKVGLGLTNTQFGSLSMARHGTGWFGTVGSGYLGDRFAHRAGLMLAISLGILGVSFLLAGFAPTYVTMLLAMLLVGIGPSLYHAPAISTLSKHFPDRHGFAIALHGTGGSIGQALGPITVGGLLVLLTWQGVLRVSLFPVLLTAVGVWSMMRSFRQEPTAITSAGAYLGALVRLLKSVPLLILFVVTLLRSFGQFAVSGFLPVYLTEDLAFSTVRIGLYLSMAQVVGIFAQPAMGAFSDKMGRRVVLIPAMIAQGLLSLALAFADPGWQLVLTILVLGAFAFALHSILLAAAIDLVSHEMHSSVVSLIYAAAFAGAIAPLLAGIIADRCGVPSAFLFGGSFPLLAVLVLAAYRLPKPLGQAAAPEGR